MYSSFLSSFVLWILIEDFLLIVDYLNLLDVTQEFFQWQFIQFLCVLQKI